jgi:hypothetical protein
MSYGGVAPGSSVPQPGSTAPQNNPNQYTSANRTNYVPVGANGQVNPPIYQQQSQNYNTGNNMNVSQYGQQPQNVSSQTMQPAQQTSMFGGQMQGGGYGQFGTNNPYNPKSNSFLNINQNINQGTEAEKVGAYRDSLNRGFNDQQIQSQVTGLFGPQTSADTRYLQTQARLPVQAPQYQMQPSFNYQQPSYGGMGGNNFIPDAPLPKGMSGTSGGFGYDPATGRVDLGTAGGSGQFTSQTMQPPQSFTNTNYLQSQARPPVQPAQTNYGPSQAIVGRSSQIRSTPNVMRRAGGGIASLIGNVK